MTTRHAVIYHCERCGSVVHEDSDQPAPTCCGEPMQKAAEETVTEDEGDEESSP